MFCIDRLRRLSHNIVSLEQIGANKTSIGPSVDLALEIDGLLPDSSETWKAIKIPLLQFEFRAVHKEIVIKYLLTLVLIILSCKQIHLVVHKGYGLQCKFILISVEISNVASN